MQLYGLHAKMCKHKTSTCYTGIKHCLLFFCVFLLSVPNRLKNRNYSLLRFRFRFELFPRLFSNIVRERVYSRSQCSKTPQRSWQTTTANCWLTPISININIYILTRCLRPSTAKRPLASHLLARLPFVSAASPRPLRLSSILIEWHAHHFNVTIWHKSFTHLFRWKCMHSLSLMVLLNFNESKLKSKCVECWGVQKINSSNGTERRGGERSRRDGELETNKTEQIHNNIKVAFNNRQNLCTIY